MAEHGLYWTESAKETVKEITKKIAALSLKDRNLADKVAWELAIRVGSRMDKESNLPYPFHDVFVGYLTSLLPIVAMFTKSSEDIDEIVRYIDGYFV